MLEYFQIVPNCPLTEGEKQRMVEVMKQTVGHADASIQTPFIDDRRTNDTAEFGSVATMEEAEAVISALSNAIRGVTFTIVTRKDEGADRFKER